MEKQPKCKNCWDKGFATVFSGIVGFDDFGGEGFYEYPSVHIKYCKCKKGRNMLHRSQNKPHLTELRKRVY
jgi:hypothetical protein